MSHVQPGILAPPPALARFFVFTLEPGADAAGTVRALGAMADGEQIVVGLGSSLVAGLGREMKGLRPMPHHSGPGIDVPSTPAALWCWLRGDDRGELLHLGRKLRRALAPAFRAERVIDAFRYGEGRDLSGYMDGTENPTDDKAIEAAVVQGRGAGMDGSSFVAVQQWVHDLDRIEAMEATERDHVIGRSLKDDEELDEAPESAHVKRTAQESFEPEAFVLRRSMPWADERREGLVFIAFGRSFDAFEALLGRMVGAEDGTVDALFRFTRPITGSYFWCPPVTGGRLDLKALGL
jgi:putative iron-dependent peroxidase